MVSTATRQRGSYHRLQQENQMKSIHTCMYVRTLLNFNLTAVMHIIYARI